MTACALLTLGRPDSLSLLPQTQLFLTHIFQVTRPVTSGDRKMSALGNFQPAQSMSDSPGPGLMELSPPQAWSMAVAEGKKA